MPAIEQSAPISDSRAPLRAPEPANTSTPHHHVDPAEGQIRKVLPAERHLLVEHLLRLDPLSRFMRFGGVVSDGAIARHGTRVTSGDAMAIGYFVDGELRAVAELHPLPRRAGKPASAEAAFSVEREFQGKGIGSALMRHLVLLAQNRGIEELQVVFLPSNAPMKNLAVHHAANFSMDDDEMIGRVQAPHATVFSRLREFLGDVFAVCSAAFDLQERTLPPSMRGN
ncbi:GNAT superfamily N-acetyltransferase [Angulomicrobium tetraedrale]|uniref:GNAT superfamily N-acetyltransferase n=1 Tax=Ancylobacter tetraedralis TaxID=217068 RepID=A0A839Z5V3_9HYPH|nr:GNAT family N-acetyltransferase [Ancylobacter tetraedralis]MBB3771059.1 GNAT superfamily N-acetyltransferase [Ancylobacter tetraedralis]